MTLAQCSGDAGPAGARAAMVAAAQEGRALVCACGWGATTGGSGQNQGSRARRLWWG